MGEKETDRSRKKRRGWLLVSTLQPAFDFAQTAQSWCPMPYKVIGIYNCPLLGYETDGERNIQALGDGFLMLLSLRCFLLTDRVTHEPSERESSL